VAFDFSRVVQVGDGHAKLADQAVAVEEAPVRLAPPSTLAGLTSGGASGPLLLRLLLFFGFNGISEAVVVAERYQFLPTPVTEPVWRLSELAATSDAAPHRG
jgi:hypothetical protein